MPRAMTGAQIARVLRQKAAALRNGQAAESLRAQVVAVIVDDALEGFARGEDPDGRPWAPLKRPRKAGSSKPLVASGNLLEAVRSLRSSTDRGSGTREIGGMRQVAARAPYARFHQTGTRKMPARRFLGVGSRGRRRLDRAVAQWANEWINGLTEG